MKDFHVAHKFRRNYLPACIYSEDIFSKVTNQLSRETWACRGRTHKMWKEFNFGKLGPGCCQQTEGVLVRVKVWGSTLSPPIQFYLPQCLNIFLWRSWLVLSAIKICVVCASGCEFHQGLRRGQEHVIRCCSATLYQLMGSASPVTHGAFKRETLHENGHILTLA